MAALWDDDLPEHAGGYIIQLLPELTDPPLEAMRKRRDKKQKRGEKLAGGEEGSGGGGSGGGDERPGGRGAGCAASYAVMATRRAQML